MKSFIFKFSPAFLSLLPASLLCAPPDSTPLLPDTAASFDELLKDPELLKQKQQFDAVVQELLASPEFLAQRDRMRLDLMQLEYSPAFLERRIRMQNDLRMLEVAPELQEQRRLFHERTAARERTGVSNGPRR